MAVLDGIGVAVAAREEVASCGREPGLDVGAAAVGAAVDRVSETRASCCPDAEIAAVVGVEVGAGFDPARVHPTKPERITSKITVVNLGCVVEKIEGGIGALLTSSVQKIEPLLLINTPLPGKHYKTVLNRGEGCHVHE